MPSWIAPTVAVSLVVIAASFLVVGVVSVAMALGLRRKSRALSAQITALTSDARGVAARIRGEVESYADLSSDARVKLRAAIETVESRLQDLDALAEVVQAEVEETALSAATLLRTARGSGRILGAARRALRRRRRSEGAG